MPRTFLARQLGDTDALVWLHVREEAAFDRAVFLAELQHLVSLSAQVPKIHSVLYGDISGGTAWAASPYLAGAKGLVEATDGVEPGPAAIRLVIELGERLSRCYDLGWVHATLSPERVLVTPDDGHVITHFGLARLFELGGREARRSPRYAAPELLKEGAINQRTDVYGLGTVLYELVCRRELYAGHDNLVVSALSRPPEFPIATPRALREVIAKALAKDPRDRYPSVEHLIAHLHEIAAGWGEPRSRSGGGRALPMETARSSPSGMDVAPRARGEEREDEKPASTSSPSGSASAPRRNAPDADGGEPAQAARMEPPPLGSAPRERMDVPAIEPHPGTALGRPAAAPHERRRHASPWMSPSNLAVTVLVLALLGLFAAGVHPRRPRPLELVAGLAGVAQGAATRAAGRTRMAPRTPPAVESVAAPSRVEGAPAPSRRSRVARQAGGTARLVLDGLYCEELYPCEHESW
ncbi:serine/threonine protein kinase [Sorangium sp. So ce1024]|uniref:serine/threonine protein kinase n=1 Tax=unclassified Sorangium TaxID=2621164 RepID=UPI003F01545F